MTTLAPHERIDDLQRNGLRIIQQSKQFRFGMDAVLLANFTQVRKRDHVMDFGTGTGILPLLLSQDEPTATFTALEWQADMVDMAQRSVALNGLQERICVQHMDIRQAHTLPKAQVVVCNPPYGKQGSVLPNENKGICLARHETQCTLADILKSASQVLGHHGRLSMVFPAHRVLELCDEMRKVRIEPKRLRMVCAKVSKPPYVVLVEGLKGAKPMLHWEAPLVVYHENGTETKELMQIYHK